MNFNLVEMYNGLLRFNKHILKGGLGAGVTNLNWDRWRTYNGNNPIVQTYWTAEHNIGNGSTNGGHYDLGKYNTDGSNLSTYPAVYRGILNFFW